MNAFGFAWRSLVRQPARSVLGVLGVAAVGALLFDMLLLSQGLIVSMRDLLERTGFDVRVTATTDLPRSGPRLTGVAAVTRDIAALPAVKSAIAIRYASARIERRERFPITVSFQGVFGAGAQPWTLLEGQDVHANGEIVVDRDLATRLSLAPGATLALIPDCGDNSALPPIAAHIAGIVEFPFELGDEHTIGGTLATLESACGANAVDEADMILVTSTGDAGAAATAIAAARPDVRAATNEQMLGRVQQGGFTYFRQISTVLTTVTLTFSMLLITVLLTVSVNQRTAEIAALRALGFSRRRMVADVLSESALIVGIGGLLSLPLGGLLAVGLDHILRRMPGIPAQLHFFVYQTSALETHVALLVVTAIVAALYPMRIVARLPIAATLRAEVIG